MKVSDVDIGAVLTAPGPVDIDRVITAEGAVNIPAVLTPPDGPGDAAAILNGADVPDVIIIPPPPRPVDDNELARRQTNDIG